MIARSTRQPTLEKNKEKGNQMMMNVAKKQKRKNTQEKPKMYNRSSAKAPQISNCNEQRHKQRTNYNQRRVCLLRMKQMCA